MATQVTEHPLFDSTLADVSEASEGDGCVRLAVMFESSTGCQRYYSPVRPVFANRIIPQVGAQRKSGPKCRLLHRASEGIVYKLRSDLLHEFTPFFAHYKPYFRGKADTVCTCISYS
jgi:hypothetical protein